MKLKKDSKGRFLSKEAICIRNLRERTKAHDRGLKIVAFPYDRSVNRFGTTYSICEGEKFWVTSNGARRAWSSWEAASAAITDDLNKR